MEKSHMKIDKKKLFNAEHILRRDLEKEKVVNMRIIDDTIEANWEKLTRLFNGLSTFQMEDIIISIMERIDTEYGINVN